jgi:CDP-diacylglycerol---serine O-phosphatidyltransferase
MRKQIPNLITLGNLFCGCLAVDRAMHDEVYTAGILIFVAALLDLLDGMAARALGVTSEMGKQLDSLADVVSFGLAPAFILISLSEIFDYHLVHPPFEENFHYIALLLPLCAAWRLARFNTEAESTTHFSGLATPAVGLLIASLPLDFLSADPDAPSMQMMLFQPPTYFVLVVGLCWLMVSRVKLVAFKHFRLGGGKNLFQTLFLATSVTLAATIHFAAGLPILAVYLFGSYYHFKRYPN